MDNTCNLFSSHWLGKHITLHIYLCNNLLRESTIISYSKKDFTLKIRTIIEKVLKLENDYIVPYDKDSFLIQSISNELLQLKFGRVIDSMNFGNILFKWYNWGVLATFLLKILIFVESESYGTTENQFIKSDCLILVWF